MICRLGVVLVWCGTLLLGVAGYPHIAPRQACWSMRPMHRGYAQSSPAPYSVEILSTTGYYEPNQEIEVSIKGQPGKIFRGFLLQARTLGGETVGTFTAPESRRWGSQVYCENTALTHDSPRARTQVIGKWRAPAEQVGPVVFHATFVQDFTTYWAGVKSVSLPSIGTILA